ncbi:hypothetical protein [Actinacidiphila glaucinigra]|uniref:hypothetical protein n=1 Tax=Actinacidiphila glaucinigra TaxID=235986 RepID=UPI0029ABE5CA|nr:hypothetical protein [Streptomyces sp. PA03-3a]
MVRSICSGYLADVAEGYVDFANKRTGADGSATANARNHAGKGMTVPTDAMVSGLADATECPGDRLYA